MKIDVIRTLDDQVYICSIATSSFSEADQGLMSDFGTPDINLGGDHGGAAASVVGDVDMSSGFDWDADPENFRVTVNEEDEVLVSLDADCDDLDEVLVHINNALATAGIGDLVEAVASSNYVELQTIHLGDDQELTVAAGDYDEDALTTLGITVGTYDGDGAPDFTLPDRLRPVNTLDTPMVQRFDARDERFSGAAQLSAEIWIADIVYLIKAAMTALRTEHDTFSGETSETY